MAGLGGGRDRSSSQHHQQAAGAGAPPESWFLYRNPDELSSYRGFELWQQQQQHQPRNNPSSFGLGIGPDEPQLPTGFAMTRSAGGGSISCQDCGNQAKKDCAHSRCRTCCRSRGFECQTHVKSTWVAAPVRRERQQKLSQQQQNPLLRSSSEGSKRLREAGGPSSSSALVHHRNPSSTGMEVGRTFPAEVSAQAVFRCVRVSAIDEGEDQYAYQTAVSIGGHVFKGLLYDQGLDPSSYTPGDSSSVGGGGSSSGGGGGGIQQLNFMSGGAAEATAFIDPSSMYHQSSHSNPFLPSGTQFFPPQR
uniref:Uncharacterized protein n=1 Tax=Kalanchoe fedtschenkoi TaxID=63787 RepID=A0A7N0UBT0_KALFE